VFPVQTKRTTFAEKSRSFSAEIAPSRNIFAVPILSFSPVLTISTTLDGSPNAATPRLSEESASVFPRKLPVAERRPDGSVGAATEKARVGVPFVYRAVVRNFEEFAIEPNELNVALNLPPELAFASVADVASSATVESKRRAVFRLNKRLAPRSEFEFNVDLAAETPGVAELEFELLDATTGAPVGVVRRELEIVASQAAPSNAAQEPR
jgi:hypothetical protein